MSKAMSKLRRLIAPHRVPVRLQLNEVECGAACLAMVLSYHGRATEVSECREPCGVGRDGVTALAITQAARSFGLRVRAYRLEPDDLRRLPLPAIVHWEFKHFVVVERIGSSTVEIVDPASGRQRLSSEEFDQSFTGITLTFEAGQHFDRQAVKHASPWRTLLAVLLQSPGAKWSAMQVLGASVVLQVLGLALPLLTKIVVDHLLPSRQTGLLTALAVGISVMVLAQGVGSYLRAAVLIALRSRLDAQMMLGFFEHLLSLPFSFFQRRSSGDLLMRLNSNSFIRDTLTERTIGAVLDAGLVLSYLVALLVLSPTFAGVTVVLGSLQVLLLVASTGMMHRLMQSELETQATSQGYVVEAVRGIATVKASGREDRVLDRWTDLFYNHLKFVIRRSWVSALMETLQTTLRTASPLILLWIGARTVLSGSMSLGTMLALSALAAAFLAPLASLIGTGRQLQLVGAHLERVFDVMRAEPEQVSGNLQAPVEVSGRIELRNVSFRYSAEASQVLRSISVTIEPGQRIAIVGATGSGKTTLGLLVLGLVVPTEGEVLFDGVPFQELDRRVLRQRIGVVLQEPFLFNASIRQVISGDRPEMSPEQVEHAARMAAIHDEIMAMPMAYETRVAEGGSALSGGQRQRLALARALADEPSILLLDEATSHLDAETERAVVLNIDRLNCTQIVIAHRLSTICDADLILVLDQGQVVERGTHDELLRRGERYAELLSSQLGNQAVRAPPHAGAA
jgi:ABC-type bacteriocin/lantibiotic exporter with double-glycine peptidase domain